MIRLACLQFRAQAVAALGALTAVTVALAVTAPHLASLYDASGIAACRGGDCASTAAAFLDQVSADQVLYFLGIGVLFVTPLVIGMFWGAPLVARELEAGTFRLAWTQGVTRTRWLAVKLAVIGLAAMLSAGLLSLMLTWWSGPVDTALALKSGNSISFIRVGPVLFAVRGIAPVGYAAFAFALGVTAGILIRRTVPACRANNQGACAAVLDRLHLRDLITYQPAGRFWSLQWYETAVFLALAAILAGICLWRIRHLPS
jgi:hypothetical protein